jgi:transcriptional regulator with GAF, ATPase, and Fis domain
MMPERGDGKRPDEVSTWQRAAFDPSPAIASCFVLVVIEGPSAGRSFAIDGSQRVLLGKSTVCDVHIDDHEVSRRHLALEPSGQRLRITDLDSTNGTWVDGLRVVDAFLRGGEVVRVGRTAFRVDEARAKETPPLPTAMAFGNMVGASTEMRRLYPVCARLAASTIPAVLEGETGTGKEVLAESIHENGPRAEGPFVVFDCTAVPPSLVESELFGHEKGAFTGATSMRRGVFEQAHGGTLLIDEIGDLDLALQPKLLRALERSEFRRVGGDRVIRVDVRVLAATRRDLDREVQAGRFRDDLFHRLAVGRIELPPLRRRRGDLMLLVARFCEQMGASERAISPEVVRRWEDYAWPGNVRELRNAVARAIALGEVTPPSRRGPPVDAAADPSADLVERVLAMGLPLAEARQRVFEEFEQRYIDRMLEEHHGNVTRAAAASRVGRRYFQRLRAKRS